MSFLKKLFSLPEYEHPIFGVMKYDRPFWSSHVMFPETASEIYVLVEGKIEVEKSQSAHEIFWQNFEAIMAH